MATTPNVPVPSYSRGKPKRLTPEERTRIIQDVLCRNFQKLDRIMIGTTNLSVQPSQDAGMPAGWTTGDAIWLNFAWLNVRTDEDLIALYGLNYHELAHVIMTPRLKGKFLAAVEGINLEDCFNLMEDWRIETHFATMFSSATRYFNIMVRKLLIDNHALRQIPPEREWSIFPLVMGRFYLDPALRMRYELKFRKELQGRSRMMELEEAEKNGQIGPKHTAGGQAVGVDIPGWWDEISDHFTHAETTTIGFPGMRDSYLKLLDLEGDVRIDKMMDLTREFVSRKWSSTDSVNNRELVLLVKQMVLLMPWENMSFHPVAGMPIKRNAGKGGTLGTDIPMHEGMKDDIDSEEMTAKVVSDDKAASAKLKKLAEEMENIEVEGPDDEQDEKTEPEPEVSESSEEDEKDDDSDSEDSESQESGPEGPNKQAPPPDDERIIIDPRQGRSLESDEEEEEVDGDHETAGGHLTGAAGQGENWKGKDDHAKQLTKQQLKDLDKMFRDMGVIDQILTDEVKTILSSTPIRKTMYNVRRVIEEALGENLDLESDLDNPYLQVPNDIFHQRNRLQRQLEELQGQLEGTWRDEQPTGRLSVRRLLNAPRSQFGTLFRAWIPDELDAAGIELVILLDRSSSMASAMDHASQVCWMVASAVQETEGRVHVISFADPGKDEVLLSPAKKLRNAQYQSFGHYGGTHAAGALKLALKVLKASQMPNRILAIATDGSWWDLEESVKIIQKINGLGCESILIGIGLHMERDRRGCTHVVHANDVDRAAIELRRVVQRVGENVYRRVAEDRGYHID